MPLPAYLPWSHIPSCRTVMVGQVAPSVCLRSTPESLYSLILWRWELAGHQPPVKTLVCVCVYTCMFVRVYIHIKNPKNKRPAQIPGPERGIGEDAAPPTYYPGKKAKTKRRGLPGACGRQEADLVDLDLRHQASSVLSTLLPFSQPISLPKNTQLQSLSQFVE